ncbi:siderophore-interacting protein, partial [Streptomyces minutiscleroticus]|uniref:siderophore-interacting protein n=1 Tax=Streptomyces minutiscleroticus TaxID=68238 RepID=UPI001E30B52F
MAPAAQRARRRRMLLLTIQASERVSPHFQCITLGGKDVRHLEQHGFDQSGRLFFADPGNPDVVLPTRERWMLQRTLQSGRQRSRVRTYSIRRFRPQDSAFDLEIWGSSHGHGRHAAGRGPASRCPLPGPRPSPAAAA